MARAAGEAWRWALAGLGLAGLCFAGSRELLQASARAEPFRVEVAAPEATAASAAGLRWTARVLPEALAGRVVARVDGVMMPVTPQGGVVTLDLGAVGPGHHLVELELRHQGGRTQTVTDTLLVGPFAREMSAGTGAGGRGEMSAGTGVARCGLALTIAEAAIQRIVVPALGERLLAAARGTDLLGPETRLERAELELLGPATGLEWTGLELGRGALRVRVALAGLNRVAVEAVVAARPGGPRGLALELVALGPVEFSGQLRTRVTLGGAAVGAAVTGPLAPLGAVGGYLLTDRFVARRARAEVQTRLQEGLARASAVALLPERSELLVGEPRSAVALEFCGPVTIARGTGIATRLALRSLAPAAGPGPGPVARGVVVPLEPGSSDMSGETEDVRLDLSLDAVNALLYAWTGNGLLAERAAAAGWVPRVDAELQAWTRLTLAGLQLDRAPVLMAADQGAPGPEGDAWALSFGGLRLDLRGGEATGRLVAAGRGWVTPRFDAASGRLELGGYVDRLRLTCIAGAVLTPCFGVLLELGEVESRLDAVLAPGTGQLPSLDLRGLLRARTVELRPEGLDVAEMRFTVPAEHPGVLRVTARLR